MSIYSIDILSVSQATNGRNVNNGNEIFSALIEIPVKIFLCTFLTYMSIYSINILSVGQATKGP